MHFDLHKKFQLIQITRSLSNDHFITFNDNHHFDDERVIWSDWIFLWGSKCINVALLPNISPLHPLWEALEAKRSDRAPKIWLSSRYVTAPFLPKNKFTKLAKISLQNWQKKILLICLTKIIVKNIRKVSLQDWQKISLNNTREKIFPKYIRKNKFKILTKK